MSDLLNVANKKKRFPETAASSHRPTIPVSGLQTASFGSQSRSVLSTDRQPIAAKQEIISDFRAACCALGQSDYFCLPSFSYPIDFSHYLGKILIPGLLEYEANCGSKARATLVSELIETSWDIKECLTIGRQGKVATTNDSDSYADCLIKHLAPMSSARFSISLWAAFEQKFLERFCRLERRITDRQTPKKLFHCRRKSDRII